MIKLAGLFPFSQKRRVQISVILPVYNAEKYLHKCLESIINQGMKELEIIAVNDCSTDNSLEILKKYRQQFSFLRIIDHTLNMGAAVARNGAIKQATGKYIAFIDSDDWFGEKYLETLYTEAENTKADIVFSNMLNVDQEGVRKYGAFYRAKGKYFNKKITLADLPCDWRSTSPWMKLYNRAFVINNDLKFQEGIRLGAEDVPFSWMSYFAAKKISFCENVYYYYNFIPDSLDRCVNENIMEIFDVLDFTKKEYLRFDPERLRLSQLDTLYVSHIYYQFSKIVNAGDNLKLASKYWRTAHKKLDGINSENVINNVFLLDQEKEYFADVAKCAEFELGMQRKYLS